MKIQVIGALALGALAVANCASAASVYDGNLVTFQYYAYGGVYDGNGSPTTFVAPDSATFASYFDVTVVGNQIIYSYTGDTTWSPSAVSLDSGGLYVDNGSVIYSAGGEPSITSVTLDPASMLGASGFNASDITFNSGAVAVTWMNQTFAVGDTVILDVNGSVPEPATWALMLVGLGGLGASLRSGRRIRSSLV
jgi:hypothetical protein